MTLKLTITHTNVDEDIIIVADDYTITDGYMYVLNPKRVKIFPLDKIEEITVEWFEINDVSNEVTVEKYKE